MSGKTSRAIELKDFFVNKYGKKVEIISEDEAIAKLGYEKNSTYLDSQKEKRVRGYLKSEVLKLIGKDNVVILDGSNYIKGKIQLFCQSFLQYFLQILILILKLMPKIVSLSPDKLNRICTKALYYQYIAPKTY